MAVFLDYSRSELDRQFDNRAKVPNYPDYIKRWERDSEAARRTLAPRLDVRFGASPRESLDVFPARSPKAPVHVFIHGGYWKMLSKNEFAFVALGSVAHGAATVVIDYGLIPDVDMDTLVAHCRGALAWVWRNADSFGGDRERIHVSGHSAGGHLVGMMLATDWASFDGLTPDILKGGYSISGLHDLEPIRLCFLNDDLGLDAQTAARNSPCRLERRSAAPLWLYVGDREGPEYLRQSQVLADAWREAGAPPEVVALPGHDHFSIVTELADPRSYLTREIVGHMGLG